MSIREKQRILNQFYIDQKTGELDLENYGEYRMGLTGQEIETYIKARAKKLEVKKLVNKFYDIAGVNTMAVSPNGESLMYRHDVKRFSDVLFGKTKRNQLSWD